MRTVKVIVYKFQELNKLAQERAIVNEINRQIELETDSLELKQMMNEEQIAKVNLRTAVAIYDHFNKEIGERLKTEDHEYTADGELFKEVKER